MLQHIVMFCSILFFNPIVWSLKQSLDEEPTTSHALMNTFLYLNNLTNFQYCKEPFMSHLYDLIDQDLYQYKGRGISQEIFDETMSDTIGCKGCEAMLFIQIINNNLYTINHKANKHWSTRAASVIGMLLDLLAHKFTFPSTQFLVYMGDTIVQKSKGPFFAFSKKNDSIDSNSLLFPCHSFYNLPENHINFWKNIFTQHFQYAFHHPINDRDSKLFWRGSWQGSPTRARWSEYSSVHDNITDINMIDRGAKQIDLLEHCKYKLLAYFGGHSYSARLKYLMVCGSVVFFVNHDHRQYWYNLLEANKHYIMIDSTADPSIVEPLLGELENNPVKINYMNRQTLLFVMKYLNPMVVRCYQHRLITKYSELLQFVVIPKVTI
eukprot:gene7044-9619_t